MQFSGKQLPDWGFNQHEIVTDRVIHQDDTIWNVEEHRYTKSNTFELFLSVFFWGGGMCVHMTKSLMLSVNEKAC